MFSKKAFKSIALVSSTAVLLAACTSKEPTKTEQPKQEVKVEENQQKEVQAPEQTKIDKEAIQKDYEQMALKGYWVSRAQLANLVMKSGMGVQFMPPKGAPQKMAESVGISSDKLPMNPHLTQAVFASGDPHFIKERVEGDLSTFRWDSSTFDQTIKTSDQALTIIKELEWAKEFHNEETFMPLDPFLGLVLTAEAKMNTKFVIENLLEKGKGFVTSLDGKTFEIKDNSITFYDQAMMLWALSDVVGMLSNKDKFPRYYDEKASGMFKKAAVNTFKALKANEPTSIKDQSVTLTALEWYAAIAPDQKDEIEEVAQKYTTRLTELDYENVTDHALGIRGFASAYRITGDRSNLDHAISHYEKLESRWDSQAGVYQLGEGVYIYTPFDAGAIIGALHVTKAIVGPELNDEAITYEAAKRAAEFYKNAVEVSGMQPSGEALKDGSFGRADTANAEVRFNIETGKWRVSNNRYVTHDNMYLANELIWLLDEKGLIQPFPEVK
jgi:hypothetical protein